MRTWDEGGRCDSDPWIKEHGKKLKEKICPGRSLESVERQAGKRARTQGSVSRHASSCEQGATEGFQLGRGVVRPGRERTFWKHGAEWTEAAS